MATKNAAEELITLLEDKALQPFYCFQVTTVLVPARKPRVICSWRSCSRYSSLSWSRTWQEAKNAQWKRVVKHPSSSPSRYRLDRHVHLAPQSGSGHLCTCEIGVELLKRWVKSNRLVD
ncbi:hypothetical protein O9929_22350 [Vibrio lentus]|nr:hypothetical protein [Vibrio lentus]